MDYIAALIPVPMKGTMHYWFVGRLSEESFNPRTHEGYDAEAIIKIIQKGL